MVNRLQSSLEKPWLAVAAWTAGGVRDVAAVGIEIRTRAGIHAQTLVAFAAGRPFGAPIMLGALDAHFVYFVARGHSAHRRPGRGVGHHRQFALCSCHATYSISVNARPIADECA